MQINDLQEFNCLMRHGVKEETLDWYWTDGNDIGGSGVWTHAYDNSDISFFPPRVRCACNDNQVGCSAGGEAFVIYIGHDVQYRGNYCDMMSSAGHYFICEATV